MSTNGPDLNLFAGMPHDGSEPVFSEPWEAHAFAMALRLNEAGVFTWVEWAATLATEIERAQADGDRDLGDTYYRHWLNALETLVTSKGLLGVSDMAQRKDEWRRAYLATPHGEPIELSQGQTPD
jgi:nitrile hydratase accessory protein